MFETRVNSELNLYTYIHFIEMHILLFYKMLIISLSSYCFNYT